jgi:hypothetical protein
VSQPTGAEVAGWIKDALTEIYASANRLPDPICECGACQVVQNHGLAFPGQPNGIYCVNGHRLPGQDMP